jgi:DinB superfamily
MPDPLSLRTILKSQYHAALAMLRETIERCPEDLWVSEEQTNAFWQVAYHTLFFAQLYMLEDAKSFDGWAGHQRDVQHPDGIAGPPDPESRLPLIPRPYTKAETLAYWNICDQMVDAAIDRMDLERADSGFYWYRMSKFEHQLVNLRHIQHHTAQLADRLRHSLGIGTRWVGGVPAT